jgi:hypothetical protein
MRWVSLIFLSAAPTLAAQQQVALMPFSGPKSAQARTHLSAALCKKAHCVPPATVLTPQHTPDWAKMAVYGVRGVVSGRTLKSHGRAELEVIVATSASQPAWTTTINLGAWTALAQGRLVSSILQQLDGAGEGDRGAPPPPPAPTPPPAPELAAKAVPEAAPIPDAPPGESAEERAARASAADQAWATSAKAASKPAPAPAPPKVEEARQTASPAPTPAPKSVEPEPAPQHVAASRGTYKPLPPELLSFTPRI